MSSAPFATASRPERAPLSLRGVPTAEVFQRAVDGERRALGRLLTLVERGGAAGDEIAEISHPKAGRCHVVGLTGAPGAGKSTITGRLAAAAGVATGDSHRGVGVVAIDPSSPITGGAILGDRIRMDEVIDREGTFVRSMATRGSSGGLALAVPGAIRVLDSVDYNPVIIETVGVGQVEVDIAGTADTTIVVVTPGWGDAVQANKAGLLEVADIFVVNKAERPGAADARRDLELMLDLGAHPEPGKPIWRAPIVMTTATDGIGIDDLWSEVENHREWLTETGELNARRQSRDRFEMLGRIDELLGAIGRARAQSPVGEQLLKRVESRELSPTAAAAELLADLLE